jgi:hypothetical protein
VPWGFSKIYTKDVGVGVSMLSDLKLIYRISFAENSSHNRAAARLDIETWDVSHVTYQPIKRRETNRGLTGL